MFATAIAVLLAAVQADAAAIERAIANPARSEAYRALDANRQPAEILTFARLRPGMQVLDVGTGGGYFTEILADAVGPEGAVVGWNGPAFAARPNVRRALERIRTRHPATTYYATPTTSMALPRGRFDLVLLHLTYHDFYWESAEFGLAKVEPRAIATELFAATKAGGIVLVVDHVAAGGRETRAEVDATHRIDPAVVLADFEAAGFVLDGQSDALRRSDDDRSLRVFNAAIRGKTDRFMVRFRKPE
jgi:predicted methyltransferase